MDPTALYKRKKKLQYGLILSFDHYTATFEFKNYSLRSTSFNYGICLVGGRRHLIFATRHQLDLLNRAKSWYVDATFKLCRQPFTQLLTVNAFVKADDYVKQVPLVFVLMSGKRKRDYRAVFRELLELLPSPALRQVTLDFECAVWKVLRQLLPEVKLLGCVFHWTPALWRKVSVTYHYLVNSCFL